MTLRTEGTIGMTSHNMNGQAQESNPGEGWGGAEAGKPYIILSPINPGITKTLLTFNI
ncbi:unnamed protein product [marine sediment metagenome]|uniref:Uncharacterized protein n=1 Tax=marine sediment metagenome TaxID=412755 RepID=X1FL23_9ZZZZ